MVINVVVTLNGPGAVAPWSALLACLELRVVSTQSSHGLAVPQQPARADHRVGIALSQNLVVGAANVANPSSEQMAVIFAFVVITNIGC